MLENASTPSRTGDDLHGNTELFYVVCPAVLTKLVAEAQWTKSKWHRSKVTVVDLTSVCGTDDA